MMCSVKKK